MTVHSQPHITGRTDPLPFDRLSPADFERLCLWLVRREGFERVEYLGQAGSEQGRDLVAWRDERRVAFQCKRVREFGPRSAVAEIEKIRSLAVAEQPHELVFLVTSAVSAKTRKRAREAWGAEATCQFWTGHELDEQVKRFPEIVEEFFQLPAARPSLRRSEVASGVMSIPRLPPHFLPRPEHLEPLKRALLHGDRPRLGLTGHGKVGVQGMGGIGKTVLAAAVAHDPEVERAFPDGVVWVTVGQEPSLLELQQELAEVVGAGSETVFRSEHQGKLLLRRALKDQTLLLVIDDVWDARHAAFLDVVGVTGRLLITTRNREVLVDLGAEERQIEVLSSAQARSLLASWAGQPLAELPALADRVAAACGHLPLALAMIGAMVRLRPTAWADALERLRRADLDKIRRQFPDYPYPDLLRALEVSVEALDPAQRQRYIELAVFPEDAAVPSAAVEVLWSTAGLDGIETRELIDRLVARSLARLDEAGRLGLHDLQRDYVRHQAADPRQLHQRLVDGYRARAPGGLAEGTPDGYFFEHIATHLSRAGRGAERRALLSDFCWLEAKLRATSVQALLADYEALPAGDSLHRVGEALRLAAHVLAKAPAELAAQLEGRLLDEADDVAVARLLEGARRGGAARGWLRPLRRSLEKPGGALLQILEGHADEVRGVAVLADGRVISASTDRTLRVWDPATGESLLTLEGHRRGVCGVAALADGRAVSASHDRTLRVWDTTTGTTLRILEGHTDDVRSVAVLADGRVVSASNDRTLRVWNPTTGESLRTLEGHADEVRGVAALADGRVVSASNDHTLRLWDPATGESLQTLAGHTSIVRSVAALADGRVVSASADATLQVWDPATGEPLQVLEGHGDGVWGVAALADGRVVSASSDRTLRIWDPTTGESLSTLAGHTNWVIDVAALVDGQLVSASSDRTLRVWDTATGESSPALGGHRDGIGGVALLADGRTVSASFDHTLRVWDPTTHQSLQVLEGHTGWVVDVAVLADGRVVSASHDRTLRLWNPTTGRPLQILEGHQDGVWGVAVLADGRVVSASCDRTLRLWNPTTGESLRTLEGHVDGVNGVAVLADGRIVSASQDRTLRVWDAATGALLRTLEGHTAAVWGVAVLADGRLASASHDRTLRLWDPTTGASLRTLEGHTSSVMGVTALAGGRIVSASHDRTLRAWNTATGAPLATFHADAPVLCVAADPKTRVLVAGDDGGRLHPLRFDEP